VRQKDKKGPNRVHHISKYLPTHVRAKSLPPPPLKKISKKKKKKKKKKEKKPKK
jgi:hypothetical protein